MGELTDEEINSWMESAGDADNSAGLQQHVVKAGKFLKDLAQLNNEEACLYLSTIDFTHSVTVVRLPTSVFVQRENQECADQHREAWYIDTGLTKAAVGLGGRLRKRKLFAPEGVVPALKVTALEMKDRYSLNDIFSFISPATKAKIGPPTRGAGAQYLVFNRTAFREI